MANNVEKFVVDLGFSQKDLNKLKELLKLQQTANGEAKKRAKTAKQQAREQLQSQKVIDKLGQATAKTHAQILDYQKKQTAELNKQKRIKPAFMNMPSNSMFEKNQAARVRSNDYDLARDQFARQKVEQLKRAGVANAEAYREQARAAFGLRGATAKLNNDIREQIDLQRRNRMQIQKTNIAMQGLNDSTRHMIRSYASIYAGITSTSFIIKTGQDFERMEAGMLAASESAEVAKINLEFLRKESMRLGFDLAEASKGFVKLAAAAGDKATNEEVQEVFTAVTEAATVFQLSMDDTTGTIKAIQQMFSKSGIMAQEFKEQLGDRIPIAMRALEKSTGKTAKQLFKMMEMGQLGVEYIVPFARALGEIADQNNALEKATNTSQKAQDRFFNTLKLSAEQVYEGDMEKAYVDLLNSLTKFMTENEDSLKALGQGFALLFNIIRVGTSIILPILDAFTYVLGEVANIMNSLFFGSTERELLAVGAATYFIVKAVRAMNSALKTTVGLKAASLLLSPKAMAAVAGVLIAEDTLKGAKDPNAHSAFNASSGGQAWHFLNADLREDGMSKFFDRYAANLKSNIAPAITLDVRTEEGLDVKVRNIVTQSNAEAKVEVN